MTGLRNGAALMCGLAMVLSHAGCKSAERAKNDAANLTGELFGRISRGDSKAIYENADTSYQQRHPVDEIATRLTSIKEQLGDPVSCEQKSVTYKEGLLRVDCNVKFTRGTAEEQFTWRKADSGYKLMAIHLANPPK